MRYMKKMAVILGACALTAASSFPAFATERIEDITLEIWSNILPGETGSDVEVEVDTEGCYVDSVTVTNEPDEWEEDDKPKLKIILEAENDYSFASGLGRDDVALDEAAGTVTGVSRSSKKLTISVTLVQLDESDAYYEEEYDDDYDLDVYDLLWDLADGGVGCWEQSDYARRYEVRLYRDGDAVTDVLTTEEGSYNFSAYFTSAGDYTFRARAVRSDSNKGSWRESETYTVSSSEAAEIYSRRPAASGSSSESQTGNPTQGAWLQDGIGYWWCNPDKTYPVSTWKQINGKWYYFNASGYRVENNWVQTNGIWYFCGVDGAMLTNSWAQSGGLWYYFGADGVMLANRWVSSNGLWYYVGADGSMQTNQEIAGGYWVNGDGVWEQ